MAEERLLPPQPPETLTNEDNFWEQPAFRPLIDSVLDATVELPDTYDRMYTIRVEDALQQMVISEYRDAEILGSNSDISRLTPGIAPSEITPRHLMYRVLFDIGRSLPAIELTDWEWVNYPDFRSRPGVLDNTLQELTKGPTNWVLKLPIPGPHIQDLEDPSNPRVRIPIGMSAAYEMIDHLATLPYVARYLSGNMNKYFLNTNRVNTGQQYRWDGVPNPQIPLTEYPKLYETWIRDAPRQTERQKAIYEQFGLDSSALGYARSALRLPYKKIVNRNYKVIRQVKG